MTIRLSTKGQLVLPKPIRDDLGLKPGTEFRVEAVGGKVVLEPVEPASWFGMFKGKATMRDVERRKEEELAEERARDDRRLLERKAKRSR